MPDLILPLLARVEFKFTIHVYSTVRPGIYDSELWIVIMEIE